MRIATYTSDVKKLSILSTEFERSGEDGYPMAILDNAKNNSLYGRNQFLIGELVRLADKLYSQPITIEDSNLLMFRVALLNNENIYTRTLINHATAMIPKVPYLNHEKLNHRIAGELDNQVQLILKNALSLKDNLNEDVLKLVADALGVALITLHCKDEFFSLRLKSRNYILKALRYIIFDSSSNDAIYPELNELKRRHAFSMQNVLHRINTELLRYFGLKTATSNHQYIIKAISSICENHFDAVTLDIPSILSKLDLGDAGLEKLDRLCKDDALLGQILIYAAISHPKGKAAGYLIKTIGACEREITDYNLINLVIKSNLRQASIQISESDFKSLITVSPHYPDTIKVAYLKHLNHGITPSSSFFNFLNSYLMSKFYVHSDHSSQILQQILGCREGVMLIRKVADLDNIFANHENNHIADSFGFINKLCFLAITSENDPVDKFYKILNHQYLSNKVPNQLMRYSEAIKNFESLDDYFNLFESHDPVIAKVEALKRFNPHQFELHELFDFSQLHMPINTLKCADDLKKALKNPIFSSFCDISIFKLIEHNNLVIINFGESQGFYAVINLTKLNFMGDFIYGLMKVIGTGVADEHYIQALKITTHLNITKKTIL